MRNDINLVNAIDWEMTPEEAVRLYLEWGCNWARGNYVIRSKNDVAHYFVVNTWRGRPVLHFIRRNSEEAVELAEIHLPDHLAEDFMEDVGHNKGVFSLNGNVKQWLREELEYEN
ncbi:MAG: hypothetical protein CSB33_03390 [Desulfobacterales bacterium]|nr:MAG: hypothetical protein CSB33_03390 [Desulfobacterales bacterium]